MALRAGGALVRNASLPALNARTQWIRNLWLSVGECLQRAEKVATLFGGALVIYALRRRAGSIEARPLGIGYAIDAYPSIAYTGVINYKSLR